MRFPVLEPNSATFRDFVQYWSRPYGDPNEPLYEAAIGQPLTAGRVMDLFKWKNGGNLSSRKRASVQSNYVDRLEEVHELPEDTTAEEFLRTWSKGGPIWRVFWLHCWAPDRFPILDQHVYRAAASICGWDEWELPSSQSAVIDRYLSHYLPFWASLESGDRDVDRALWAYGRFLRTHRVLIEGGGLGR